MQSPRVDGTRRKCNSRLRLYNWHSIGQRATGMPQFALTPRNIQIRDNFDAIAPKYDLTNRVLSLGIDLHWRRVAVRLLRGVPDDGTVLDLACGTCDLALEVLRKRRKARVVGADLSRVMLGLARKKVAQRFAGRTRRCRSVTGRSTP